MKRLNMKSIAPPAAISLVGISAATERARPKIKRLSKPTSWSLER